MALQAPTTSVTTNRVQQEALEAGPYPARIARVIDLGLQPTIDFTTKEPGKPAHKISVTYELLDAFMTDEDGNELEDKPRWIAEDFPLRALTSDLATSTKRMKAIDPKGELKGDWSKVLGLPCTVVLVQYTTKKNPDVVRNKVASVTAVRPRDVANMPDLQNDAKFFDLSDPDIEFFKSLPQWQQDLIKGNLEYEGSLLQARLEGTPEPARSAPKNAAKPKDEPVVEVEDDDAPW